MSRTFTDADLRVWEAYPSGGRYGLPERPKIVFHCLSAPDARARFVVLGGADEADAEAVLTGSDDGRLRELLEHAEPLD